MAKSDDPIEQTRAQHQSEPENIVVGLTKKGLEKLPIAGIAIAYLHSRAKDLKEESFDNSVLDILAAHEITIDEIKRKLESENVTRVVAIAFERIFWGASETKVKRFAAIVANTIESGTEQQDFEDATSFIRAIDELSEDDIRVLKHLHTHQGPLVSEQHDTGYSPFFENHRMTNMIREVTRLGMRTDGFYARCSRLSGYGLALALDKSHGDMGDPDKFAFRITLLGKRLIEMLLNGEKVSAP